MNFFTAFQRISSFVVVGVTNGQANPQDTAESDTPGVSTSNTYAYYGKVGFDHQYNDDWRLRITESVYNVANVNRQDLYMGDKAGNVIRNVYGTGNTNVMSSGWDPTRNYTSSGAYTVAPDLFASKTNLFLKYKDTEFYGMYEIIDADDVRHQSIKVNHYAFDIVQRFYNDKFWAALRYENAVQKYADYASDFGDSELKQYQAALGWFLSKNAVAKLEYIKQEREKFSIYNGGNAKFDGFMINAALSF